MGWLTPDESGSAAYAKTPAQVSAEVAPQRRYGVHEPIAELSGDSPRVDTAPEGRCWCLRVRSPRQSTARLRLQSRLGKQGRRASRETTRTKPAPDRREAG